MWRKSRDTLGEAARDLGRAWKSLARADIACKLLAFAVLTPLTLSAIRWMMFTGDARARADADIATFFLTTPAGVATLVVGGALLAAISALEVACLMAVGLAAASGSHLDARSALAFGASRTLPVLRLTVNMAVRLLGGLVPFAAAGGLTYWMLLRPHDINYYLAQRPPAFWAAAGIIAAIGGALVVVILRTIARWAFALPLVLFEGVAPWRALGESARRSAGARGLVVSTIAGWAIVAVALQAGAAALPEVVGRLLAPHFAGSLAGLLIFLVMLALLWAGLGLIAAVVNTSLFALALGRLYLGAGQPRDPRVPKASARSGFLLPRPARIAIAAAAGLAVVGAALFFAASARRSQAVVVVGHRGSAAGPENTLAAFRLGIEQGADFIELDVQESADGEVLVVHDSDLMKVGGSALKIWEADALQLRAVDVGSRKGPQFSAERVPTLAEALAVCKGRARMIVELKSYGHDQHLEEKVVALVEAAGMTGDTIFMSLDRAMVQKMKELRPAWRVGLLVAKAVGDLTSFRADFLAVHTGLATRSLVRQAHRAGQDVYVWTVNDAAAMLSVLSTGADGLITDRPDAAREVVARRAAMSDAQRVLVALLVRVGVRTDTLSPEAAIRP